MFDAYEAVDNIIDEINENYNESCYDDIYDELCERVECGLLSVADAELINEAAYEKYMMEASRMDKEALLLAQKDREIHKRYKKETNPSIKEFLLKKMYEINSRQVNMGRNGIDYISREGKLRIGRDDARRVARGGKSEFVGKRYANRIKDKEGDRFRPYTDERKPGYYLGLQNSIR